MKTSTISLGLALAFVTSLGACKKKESADTPAAQATPKEPAKKTVGNLDAVFGAYEKIRAKLAADDLAVQGDASGLAQAASEAAKTVPDSLRAHLESLASASKGLAAAKGDADTIRRAFGEASRPAVALIAAEPSLKAGRHVFECPMAQGYKKWVQASADISNPYMGTRMLKCGSASEP